MNNIWGVLIILDGLLTISTGEITIGLGVGNKLDGAMKYIVAIPEILLGVYIFYLNHEKKNKG